MKVAQKMSLGWLSNDQDHTEFIKMKGPHGKGFAEMAIRQYKPSENDNVSNALEHTYVLFTLSMFVRLFIIGLPNVFSNFMDFLDFYDGSLE